MLLAVVWAGLARCHSITDTTEEGMVEEHWRNPQLGGIEIGKDIMGIIGAIVVAYASMITSHNEMRAAVVLAHQGVENGFARTGIAHRSRQHTQDHTLCRIIVLQQHFV